MTCERGVDEWTRKAPGRNRVGFAKSAKMAGVAGRPTKLTPELADDLVLLLAAGASSARAARAVGVGERSVTRWLRNGLAEQVEQARTARQRARTRSAKLGWSS